MKRLLIILLVVCFIIVAVSCSINQNSETDISQSIDIKSGTGINPNKDFLYYIENDSVTISFYKGSQTELIIPDTIENLPVAKLEDAVFYKHSELESVVIPNSVKTIGDNAFEECTLLEKIIIPSSIEQIGYEAFEGTKWLEVQSDEFVIIGNQILYKYKGQNALVDIPETVEKISGLAFANNHQVTDISMSDSINEIDKNAFWNCTSLKNIKLSNNLTVISDNLFSGCNSLEQVKLPLNLTEIGDWAFFDCANLRTLDLYEGIEKIGENSFMGCDELLLRVKENSVAKEYALKKEIPFKYF